MVNAGVKRYRDLNGRHLTTLGQAEVDRETVDLQVETNQSHVRVALAARTRVLREGEIVEVDRTAGSTSPDSLPTSSPSSCEQGRPLSVEKIVALYTSRDRGDLREPAMTPGWQWPSCRLRGAARQPPARLATAPGTGSTSRWTAPTSGPRRSCTCTSSTCCRPSRRTRAHLDVGVPARGWHGEAYRGHIFWDELFIFPFLNFQRPLARRCAAAITDTPAWARPGRRHAPQASPARCSPGRAAPTDGRRPSGCTSTRCRDAGCPTARTCSATSTSRSPTTSGSTTWSPAALQFLRFAGVELLIEIARFWASIATYNPAQDRYEIHGVMGPDEYHEAYPDSDEAGLRNNTYTNVMAVWVLLRALEALQELPPHYRQELVEELMIRDEELERWRDISQKMTVVFHADGVLSQFEGYDQLREFDWEGYRAKYGNIQRLDRVLEAEGDSTNRYKVSKQPDVLMLLYLLSRDELCGLLANMGYEVTEEQLARTVDYYLARTSHGSTLSSVVTAWVLARYDPDEAWQCPTTGVAERHRGRSGRNHRRGHPLRSDGRHGRSCVALPHRDARPRASAPIRPSNPARDQTTAVQRPLSQPPRRACVLRGPDRGQFPPRPGSTHYCLGARRRCGLAPRRAAYLLT